MRDIGFNKVEDLWRDYACVKSEEISKDPQCGEWLKFRCNSRQHVKQDYKCDNVTITKVRPKITKEFDKKAKDFVWSLLSRCFAKENLAKNYVIVEDKGVEVVLTLQTRDKDPQVSCMIDRYQEKNGVWGLRRILDESDTRLEGTFFVY